MGDSLADSGADRAERSRTGTYVGVILVEALVVAALYLFSRYFSA